MEIGLKLIAGLFALLVGGSVVVVAQAKVHRPVPRFEDYAVPTPIPGRPEGPVYVANHVPDPEAVLRETAKVGPNFAGRFVVEQYTCGSACTSFAIVDVKTGSIHYPKFNVTYVCPEYEVGTSPILYRLSSRLLLVKGAIENPVGQTTIGPCGQFYYEWTGKELKLIHSEVPAAALPKHSSDVRH